jgi:hypothetical protein
MEVHLPLRPGIAARFSLPFPLAALKATAAGHLLGSTLTRSGSLPGRILRQVEEGMRLVLGL